LLKELSDTAKKMMLIILSLSFILLIISIFLIPINTNHILFSIGLLLGTLSSMLKVYLTEKGIKKTMDLEPSAAQHQFRIQYLIRYAITIIIFTGSILISLEIFFGATVGSITLPLSGYIVSFIIKKDE
jgi:hypothetical protein